MFLYLSFMTCQDEQFEKNKWNVEGWYTIIMTCFWISQNRTLCHIKITNNHLYLYLATRIKHTTLPSRRSAFSFVFISIFSPPLFSAQMMYWAIPKSSHTMDWVLLLTRELRNNWNKIILLSPTDLLQIGTDLIPFLIFVSAG